MNPGAVEDDGTLPAGRVKLVTVLAAAGDVVTVSDAAQTLGLGRRAGRETVVTLDEAEMVAARRPWRLCARSN